MRLNDFKLSARLAGGFGAVLLLLALMMGIGCYSLSRAAADTREMMATPLQKERLVSEWYMLTLVGVKRYTAIAKSTDPSLADYFANDVKVASARGSEIIKTLDGLPKSDEEKRVVKELTEARARYQAARDKIAALKKAGDEKRIAEVFDSEFRLPAEALLDQMKVYWQQQRQILDDMAKGVDHATEAAQWRIALLGALALAVGTVGAWILTRSVTGPVSQASRLVGAIAAGDLTVRVDVEGRDEIAGMLESLEQMRVSLQGAISQVRDSSDSIQLSCREVAAGNQDLSQRTEQTASSVQGAASVMDELNGTVGNTAHSASEANRLAVSAADIAERGGAVVADVVKTMTGIHSSSRRIADIIGVIDGIAFQTNILALNAAVEAARAGEQGRGFAVVAGEVRSLASRSAEAAREIKQLIAASVDQVEAGTALVSNAGSTMDEVVAAIRRVSALVSDISAACAEQAQGVSQVSSSVSQIDSSTQQNAAMVEEIAAAASSLQGQAQSLVEAMQRFRL
ncbi:methyl-accepting chemotaxis protein [Roseateles cellulosilyticus]|uniref:Methyl-accepting chemotaxis protein n=1 Tax=Pelomonas cellulosilytica TaxID=2906762 RepID=A0ABS8XVM4_9BURK|nr:methyl-accepting chemotaxis protein [Pelomonas sp. P8]MCE4554937.1 methyl-accepting chemotaxis protein [Pelomonas sp. P8]